jgi:glucokinase
MKVLAGDVGGTNARLGIVEVDGRTARLLRHDRYPSGEYPGLAPIVEQFFKESGERTDRACFGLACPVVGDDCTATNLPWTINAKKLARDIGIPRTAIINDFGAIGYGIELLIPADLATLQEGQPTPHGPIGLIGAGTGLGQGFLLWEGDYYRVVPSEGGHTDFAPADELQIGLLRFLIAKLGRVSWERLLSGPGLLNIYTYLREAGVAAEQATVRSEMEGQDPAAVIGRHGLASTDALSERTLELFAEILGAQAGNLALTLVATGGVYIGGGIAPRLARLLEKGNLMTAFRNKGRLSPLLARMPVHVIMNPNVGLLGAAAVAARLA